MAQKNKGPWWRRYKWQMNKALQRGIPWLLSFEEWCEIWRASGKWSKRGRKSGQYVMARYGDRGAYERANVRICLVGENVNEMRAALPVRVWRGADADRVASRLYAQWKRRNDVLIRPKMSDAAMGRRMVVRDGRRCWAHPGDRDYPVEF